MPDRIALYDGLLDSDNYNELDPDARDLYVRLLLLADDFGCYDGREQIIASHAYPLGRSDALALEQLNAQTMVMFYSNAGRRYLAVTRWREALRFNRKYPAPPMSNDLPDLKLRVKFGRPEGIQWKNPRGCDDVSILLDRAWKPVSPQPPEWRNRSDWSPMQHVTGSMPAVTARVEPERMQSLRAVTGVSPMPIQELKAVTLAGTGAVAGADAGSDGTQSLASTTSTKSVEEIKFENGAWIGVTEARELRWQSAFIDVAVPVELEQSAVWLAAHPQELALYSAQPGGLEAFLARWFLRESKAKPAAVKG